MYWFSKTVYLLWWYEKQHIKQDECLLKTLPGLKVRGDLKKIFENFLKKVFNENHTLEHCYELNEWMN